MDKFSNTLIANKKIGLDVPPFIIAEMSGNHNQSLELALTITEAAASVFIWIMELSGVF